jgi:hypothetical protein
MVEIVAIASHDQVEGRGSGDLVDMSALINLCGCGETRDRASM